jgi:hypothetical protein
LADDCAGGGARHRRRATGPSHRRPDPQRRDVKASSFLQMQGSRLYRRQRK